MHKNFLEKISKFLIYIVPFALVIVYQGSIFPFIVGKYTVFRGLIELALIFFVWAWATGQFGGDTLPKIKGQPYRAPVATSPFAALKNPIAIGLGIFVAVFLLATVFGVNPASSFWSNFERGEGSLQVLVLFVFFVLLALLFRDEASWRRIFTVSIWAAILVIAYGVFAAWHVEGFIGGGFCERFAGSLGNPAYLGTYMIFALFYVLYLFNSSKQPFKRKWWMLILVAFFVTFLLLSQTRGAFLGLGISLLAGLIYMAICLPKGLSRKIAFSLIVLGVILGPLAVIYRHDFSLTPFCSGGGTRILDVGLDGATIQTRFILWQQSIEAFKERPLLGWGPENFSIAFEKYFDVRHTAWFDRAHNIFFDYLVFAGALGLISFLGIFILFYLQLFRFYKGIRQAVESKKHWKNSQEDIGNRLIYEGALILALPIAYLVQGFVLFDVLPIYINTFLFLAFASWKLNQSAVDK